MLFGVSNPTAEQEAITVRLPHGEMELHSVGGILCREEYFKLTQALGLVEARTFMSHHGLEVGTTLPRTLTSATSPRRSLPRMQRMPSVDVLAA
jgi:hypothetical protein